MPTHRIFGTAHVAATPAARSLDVISAADWNASGIAAAVLASATSDGMTGEWEAELDSDELVYVLARPVPPYKPLLLGPFRPVPIEP